MQAKALMQAAKYQGFDPARTAKAITPFLLDMSAEAAFAISDDLNALLDSTEPALRSAAVVLKVRTGSPLPELAERDPEALLSAVQSLPKELAPDNVPGDLLALAENGKIEPGLAFQQATRLSNNTTALFERFAAIVEKAQGISFEKWSEEHQLAMAALGAMHQIDDADWPAGFDAYRIARADEATLKAGHDYYHHEERGCVKCHGEHGQGTEGFPPLDGSPYVLGSPERAATIVKYGLMGELKHFINPSDGKPYNAQMEPLSYMSDPQIAAVLTYVRQSWGNFAAPVTVDHVAAARKPKEGNNMWPADALLGEFPFERDRVLGSMPPPQWGIVHWSPPGSGLFVVLAGVCAAMLPILVVTWLGGRASSEHASHGHPAIA